MPSEAAAGLATFRPGLPGALEAAWRAALYSLLPRVMWLSCLPLVLSAGVLGGLSWWGWSDANVAVRQALDDENHGALNSFLGQPLPVAADVASIREEWDKRVQVINQVGLKPERLRQAGVATRRASGGPAGIRDGGHAKREPERGSLIRLALRPDAAMVPLEDALDDGQAHAGAAELALGMKALEDAEERACALGIETGAIVANKKCPFPGMVFHADRDLRRSHP